MNSIGGRKPYYFNDGASIEWVDRETIKYQEAERFTLIWVDYAPGFFSRGRILKANTIENWQHTNGNQVESITDEERKTVIQKVVAYYAKQGNLCAVERGQRQKGPGSN